MIIEIDSESHFPAKALVEMLDTLNKSFQSFSQKRFDRKLDLAVSGIEVGSVKVVLDALDGIQKIWDAREIFAAFGTHLMEAASSLLKLDASIDPKDKRALEAIANRLPRVTRRKST